MVDKHALKFKIDTATFLSDHLESIPMLFKTMHDLAFVI